MAEVAAAKVKVMLEGADTLIAQIKAFGAAIAMAETRMERLEKRLQDFERKLAKTETNRRGGVGPR